MRNQAQVRERIGWLKLLFGLLAAADLSLIGWLAQNFSTAEPALALLAAAATICSSGVTALVGQRIERKIEEVEGP